MQAAMLQVCYALMPVALASIYFFGWRSLILIVVTFLSGITAEAIFTFRQGKPVTSAVFVTCFIFSLSLPPTLPFWMAIMGILFGVIMGKMVFGGFGQNVFNPAMAGRCFLYINFPTPMTNTWMDPLWGSISGFAAWSPPVDAITRATPLIALKAGDSAPLQRLFFGNIAGSLGETSAILILLGGAYIIYRKAAPWRLALSCFLGGMVLSSILHWAGAPTMASPISLLFAGSFLFGTVFVVTEPISGAKTKPGQWIYGFMVGGLTMVLRGFSNFSEGIMFAVLLMNAFVPILDQAVRQIQARRKTTTKGVTAKKAPSKEVAS